jgi:hypothetical protein
MKIEIPGGTLSNGQLHTRPERAGRSAPEGMGRYDGKRKNHTLADPAIAYGQKRQSKPSHEFCHGAPVNDEPLQKNWEGKSVPIHPGMTPKQVALSATAPTAKAILEEAGRLGAPAGGWRK